MTKTLDEIRKKLLAMNTRGANNSTNRDKTVYPHWNIPDNTTATVRFLPDGNPDNTFFWVERQQINLTFPGIKGRDEHTPVSIKVPCIEMYPGHKNKCPILTEVRPMWQSKEPGMEDIARKYWVKRQYYMHGFVVSDPTNETDAPENPIRRFLVNTEIFNIIKAALMDPDMTYSPVDYVNGTDFIFAKTISGKYANYTTSKWARRESSLTEEMVSAIEQFGLPDMSTYLPAKPTEDHLRAQFEMFEASLAGELYDPDRWAEFYKPYGLDSNNQGSQSNNDAPATSTAAASRTERAAPVAETQPWEDESAASAEPTATPGVAAVAPATGKSPQEILAMLRNRNK